MDDLDTSYPSSRHLHTDDLHDPTPHTHRHHEGTPHPPPTTPARMFRPSQGASPLAGLGLCRGTHLDGHTYSPRGLCGFPVCSWTSTDKTPTLRPLPLLEHTPSPVASHTLGPGPVGAIPLVALT
jgi:hypothetical protein